MLTISLVETVFDGRLEIRQARGYGQSETRSIRHLPRSGSVQQAAQADAVQATRFQAALCTARLIRAVGVKKTRRTDHSSNKAIPVSASYRRFLK